MKRLRHLVLFALTCLAVNAADFEGTLRWSFNIEITDPAMKKQLAEAEKQLADPKMQAQLKEAQAAMADPQMQAMLAQNPQMKAMLEQQMSVVGKTPTAGGNPLANMFPKAVVLQTKGGKSLSVTEGGPMPIEVLNLPSEPATYLLDRKARTVTKLHADKQPAAATKTAYKVTKTAETAQILGYACTKYVVETTEPSGGEVARYLVWASTAVAGLDTGALAKVRFSQQGGDNAFLREIAGVPLKMEITTPQARVTMQAASIKAEPLADSLFTVPSGFTTRTQQTGR